jgi:ABC-type antimicrobial peptide transport system permease subunit
MLRSLTWFWRMSLAVTAGAAVASAVLTGALLVGDSVRGSLRELTLERLGAVDHALAGQRFFGAGVAARLRAELPQTVATVAPAILLQGNVRHARTRTRAAQVALQGVDAAFLELFPDAADLLRPLFAEAAGVTPPAVINEALGRELGAAVGDDVLFQLKRWSDVPRGSLLGRKDTGSVVRTVRLRVAGMVPDRGVGRFGLAVHQALPLNVFVALPALQKALRQEGEINGLLLAGDAADLEEPLRRSLTLGDLGLLLTEREGYVAIESEEFILKPAVEPVIERLAGEAGATLPVLTYLVNRIALGDRAVPYSTVSALDPEDAAAFGELALVDGSPAPPLAGGEVLLSAWTAAELGAAAGDTVELTYFVVGPREDLREETTPFVVRGVTEVRGLGADPTLSQDYPGIADSDNMGDWDPPFPIDLDAIRPQDEEYWDVYRGTPKAFVALATGQRLWETRWGRTTAVRVAGEDVAEPFRAGLVAAADLGAYGLRFQPVKRLGLEASGGATDFGQMFIFFSVFLIVSAAMLAALLFSLGVEQRVGEVGLRQAVGEPPSRVRRRLLAEGGVLAAAGALVGLAGAVGYAALMMHGLRTWWLPAVGTSRLELHVGVGSLAGGYAGAVAVVLFAIWWTLRRLRRLSTPQLLAREVEPVDTRPGGAARWTAAVVLPLAGVLLVYAVASGQTTNPALFFAIGPALLVGALALYSLRIAGSARLARKSALRRPGLAALFQMAALNSGRNRRRSLLAATLVASACFLIVTVASYQEGFSGELGKDSGTGGFRLVAESAIPLYQDLATSAGRFELGLGSDAGDALAGVAVVPVRLLPGDDTSCLNLYQPEQPRVLGVPHELVERGGFRFKSTLAETAHPWTLLEQELEDGVIPAFGDANSTQWILKLGLGEDLEMEDERGETVRLRLVGTLATSIFQSELLISEENFKKHFPSRSGFSYFLIDAPKEQADDVTQYLEAGLDAYGFDAVSAAEKLASFHAVQNTYLATFQTIGGLGLLLGTVGLAVVLARNVIERRKELATLRAFGFRRAVLTRMVVIENGLLLVWGLGIGTVAALLTAGPHVLAEAEHVPWASIAATLAAILVFGLAACAVAASRALRASLLPALKADR